jgi:hypothetical protein
VARRRRQASTEERRPDAKAEREGEEEAIVGLASCCDSTGVLVRSNFKLIGVGKVAGELGKGHLVRISVLYGQFGPALSGRVSAHVCS